MCTYDPLQINRRIWNDPENILKEYIEGIIIMHPNLIYLDSCKAVVRRDYNKLNGKVRIIGGGALIDGPTYAGFVGPGMLTAAILGLDGSASSIPTSDSIFELINYIVKDDKNIVNDTLLLIHDCPEYFLNFMLAKNKAESKNISTKVVLIRDEISNKLTQKSSSPRSPSGLILIYKLAGAMSEEGRSLNEIYETCNEIVKSRSTFSIGVYIPENSFNDIPQIEICRGDRLSDRDMQRLDGLNSTAKKVVEVLVNDFIKSKNSHKFPWGSKLVLLFNYFGSFSILEANIVIKELVLQLNHFQFEVENIYMGIFHTSIEVNGFHLSIFNLSNNLQFIHYFNAPTLAFAWPKSTFKKINLQTNINQHNSKIEKPDTNENLIQNKKKSNEEFINSRTFESDVLLTAIEFASEALIACAKKIDMLDKPSIPKEIKRCGTRLANIAKTVKTAIHKNKFVCTNLSNIIFQVALIFEDNIQDPQAKLYSVFFNTLGKAINDQEYLEPSDWLDAFVIAINSVHNLTKDTKFSNTLFAAKEAFCNAYEIDENVDFIDALEEAVNAAQKQTSHIILNSGRMLDNFLNEKDCGFSELAGAHAIGVWMRGAYEGIKMKYSHCKFQKKRTCSDFASDELPASKVSKISNN